MLGCVFFVPRSSRILVPKAVAREGAVHRHHLPTHVARRLHAQERHHPSHLLSCADAAEGGRAINRGSESTLEDGFRERRCDEPRGHAVDAHGVGRRPPLARKVPCHVVHRCFCHVVRTARVVHRLPTDAADVHHAPTHHAITATSIIGIASSNDGIAITATAMSISTVVVSFTSASAASFWIRCAEKAKAFSAEVKGRVEVCAHEEIILSVTEILGRLAESARVACSQERAKKERAKTHTQSRHWNR
mmetsp:Transcript_1465/g.3105  ORF Transcript_1465/g.3105 Transcript_1465/m.3105 type:complete len:248 (-) Transcript_1465:631-1374(-)